MALNPLNELKRRLDDVEIPLSKRLCLAKNVVTSHHFATAPKERIISEWLEDLTTNNKLSSAELQRVLEWTMLDDLTGELKGRLVQVVSKYVQTNQLQHSDVQNIISFLENQKISTQLSQQIDNYLKITVGLLQFLKNDQKDYVPQSRKVLQNVSKYYKESKKKLEFITKFLDGENLETIFRFLDMECRDSVVNICQDILFPIHKKTSFISYLQMLIRKDNLEDLLKEKGDNIQSVIKIMSVFFNFPEKRTEMDSKFLRDFIDVFISCFHKESQIIFAFVIMVTNVLTMTQDYIVPSMEMKPILFEEHDAKIKRQLFLDLLKMILRNEIDINVRLTDTFGEKISKVEIKKNFTSFLQIVMMGQLKIQTKVDNVTLQIIKTALQLDPILIEQKVDDILPFIMASKKGAIVIDSYKDMLHCLLEILFKLSRGTQFLTQILPSLKLCLDASNTEVKTENGSEKKSKQVMGSDVFPQECVELYGRLTSDLMFRQNKELLETLQKDFQQHCLFDLEEGVVSPSIIILAEVLSAILSSFLRHNKMADHTVPQHIAADFWDCFSRFEEVFLKRLGLCVLKNKNPSLVHSFLNICQAYSQLKLLNLKYSTYKLKSAVKVSLVQDLSGLLPSLSEEEWGEVAEIVEGDAVLVLNNLYLLKTMAMELSYIEDPATKDSLVETKSHLINQLETNSSILENDKFVPRALFTNLDKSQYKSLSKELVKLYLNEEATEIFQDVAIANNKILLNALVLEVSKNITKCFENCESLSKALNKTKFQMANFAKEVNIQDYFMAITMEENQDEKLKKHIELLKLLRLPYLDENYQLTAIFVLLAAKKCCQSKKIRKNIDLILQHIFELSLFSPDLYKIFPINFIYSFKDKTIIDLLTLKIKTSNLLVVKSVVEKAVKLVKTDSDLIKNVVDLLLSQKSDGITSMNKFSDPAFQVICIILPLIAKQKKAITASTFRSILANLQERLHDSLLEIFKNIDFSQNSISCNTDESMVESESSMAALNAIAAFSLTLSKYCETTNTVESNLALDCLWAGLEFFIQTAIKCISNVDSKPLHIESSIQLINVTLRYIKKLESHSIFNEKDKILTEMWKSVKTRLGFIFAKEGSEKSCVYLESLGLALKFLCELVSVEGFAVFMTDLTSLVTVRRPGLIIKDETKSDLTNHRVSKYLLSQCLKANTIGPKCGFMTKELFNNYKGLKYWIRQHYDTVHIASNKKRKLDSCSEEKEVKIVKVHDDVCSVLRVELDILEEVIFAAKKITLDYKFLDTIFELIHLIHYIMGSNSVHLRCEVTWQSYFNLFEGCVAILNSLLFSREELLEDRWPCYMQCYRALTLTLCERSSSNIVLERNVEEKLAEIAHSIEKLTHAISKRKKQVSRISAYTVADICTSLEKHAPSKIVRQHLENSVVVLIQASDSSYAMAFLKRALAGSVGQMTLTNLYTVYKRYHKYTGNA